MVTNTRAEKVVFETLNEFVEEWGLDDLEVSGATTLKGDMGFESTDIMQLFMAVQEEFPSIRLSFQGLIMQDGKFVDDLTAQQVVSFVNTEVAKNVASA